MKFSVAIIGSGSMGRHHTYGYDKLMQLYGDELEIEKKVMCSRSITPERAGELGWAECETDWTKVIRRADVDVIDISAFDSLHYPVAKAALEHGKRVICEKPLADGFSQAQELYKLSENRGIPCAVCLNYRYMHAVRAMKYLLTAGELGEIRHVHASFTMDWAADPAAPMNWRLDGKACPTGALGDIGTHLIDLCRFMGLEFTHVCGMSEVFTKKRKLGYDYAETSANEMCVFNARFQNGALGVFEASRVSDRGGMAFELYGTKGSVRWEKDGLNDLLLKKTHLSRKEEWYRRVKAIDILPYYYRWNHDFVQNDSFTLLFFDYLTGNGNSPTFADGMICSKIVDTVLASKQEPLDLDL